MEFKDLQFNLRRFSETHNLVQYALDSCRIAIINCLKENPEEGRSLDETELVFDKQEFVFNHQVFKKSYVKTQIKLYQLPIGITAEDNSDYFGYYILYTDEQGNHFDDSLVYENEKIG